MLFYSIIINFISIRKSNLNNTDICIILSKSKIQKWIRKYDRNITHKTILIKDNL